MKKIYLLVLRSYLGPLILTFFVAVFILLMQFLWKYIDDLVGKGLEWYIVLELLFYASSTFVPLALPLAILLSSIMTFGNLGEHYELVAMKSAGISLWKIMRPLIILTIAISGIAFYFSNNILPVANLKFKSLLYDVRKQKLAFDITEGIFYNGMDGIVMRIGKKEKDDRSIRDVMIYNHLNKQGNTDLTVADSGRMEASPDGRYLIFHLFNGYNYQEKTDQKNYRKNRQFQKTKFSEEYRRFDLSDFTMKRTDENLFKNNYSMLNIAQLNDAIDSLGKIYSRKKDDFSGDFTRHYQYYSMIDSAVYFKHSGIDSLALPLEGLSKATKVNIIQRAMNKARGVKNNIEWHIRDYESKREWLSKHMVAWHKKFTLSFACLVLFFIGAPLGAIIRKGGIGLPVVVSVIFFVLFHIITITGEKSAIAGAIKIEYGMWVASAVLLPLGIFLTFKATSDSPLLDFDIWKRKIGKLARRKI
ncbi:MAG: LptF/LptG family permease [Bacteroidales bacterium]|nr:LptF/LptG family permease [Bacteroidales bacterium]